LIFRNLRELRERRGACPAQFIFRSERRTRLGLLAYRSVEPRINWLGVLFALLEPISRLMEIIIVHLIAQAGVDVYRKVRDV
jgi:hypothetical protein